MQTLTTIQYYQELIDTISNLFYYKQYKEHPLVNPSLGNNKHSRTILWICLQIRDKIKREYRCNHQIQLFENLSQQYDSLLKDISELEIYQIIEGLYRDFFDWGSMSLSSDLLLEEVSSSDSVRGSSYSSSRVNQHPYIYSILMSATPIQYEIPISTSKIGGQSLYNQSICSQILKELSAFHILTLHHTNTQDDFGDELRSDIYEMNEIWNGDNSRCNVYCVNPYLLNDLIDCCVRNLLKPYRRNDNIRLPKTLDYNPIIKQMYSDYAPLLHRYWGDVESKFYSQCLVSDPKAIFNLLSEGVFMALRDLNFEDMKSAVHRDSTNDARCESKVYPCQTNFLRPLIDEIYDDIYELNQLLPEMHFNMKVSVKISKERKFSYHSGRANCIVTTSVDNAPMCQRKEFQYSDGSSMFREPAQRRSVKRSDLLEELGLIRTDEDAYDIQSCLPNLLMAYVENRPFKEEDWHTKVTAKFGLDSRNVAKIGAFRGIFNFWKTDKKFMNDVLYSLSDISVLNNKNVNTYKEFCWLYDNGYMTKKGRLKACVQKLDRSLIPEGFVYVSYVLDSIQGALACREMYKNDLYPSDLFLIESLVEMRTLLHFARMGHRVANAYDHIYTDGNINPTEFKSVYATNADYAIQLYRTLRFCAADNVRIVA